MGKGTAYLMAAQLTFLLSGYIIHFGLGRFLGPEEYGLFGIILSLLTITEIVLIRGVRDAVSKYVAEYQDDAYAILNSGIKLELVFSLVAFCIIFYFSRYIAILLADMRLVNYIRLSAMIIPLVSVYSVYIGYLSGKREFGKQATCMSVQSIGKVFGVYLLILLGLGTSGAIGGYILGSGLALIIARSYSIDTKIVLTNKFSFKKLVTFAIPLVIFSIAVSAIMNLDLLFVKALTESSIKTGYYTSTTTITRAPYYIFIALSFTLLPTISKTVSASDSPKLQEYINKSLRYLIMLVTPLTFFISSTSAEIVKLTYSTEYLPASNSVSILIFGITFITIFYILSMTIIGGGDPKSPMMIAIVLVLLDITLNLLLIPKFELEGAAIATTATCFIGLLIIAVYVKMKYGTLMSRRSFFKILLCSSTLYIIPKLFILSGIYFIIFSVILALLYGLTLFVLKELTKEDIELLSQIIPYKLIDKFLGRTNPK